MVSMRTIILSVPLWKHTWKHVNLYIAFNCFWHNHLLVGPYKQCKYISFAWYLFPCRFLYLHKGPTMSTSTTKLESRPKSEHLWAANPKPAMKRCDALYSSIISWILQAPAVSQPTVAFRSTRVASSIGTSTQPTNRKVLGWLDLAWFYPPLPLNVWPLDQPGQVIDHLRGRWVACSSRSQWTHAVRNSRCASYCIDWVRLA